jgi:site-specific DNA recombinase
MPAKSSSSLTWSSEPYHGQTNAVVGARVSTRAQDEKDTPEVQLARARRYAESHGYPVVGELREVIGGAFILARSKLREVFEAARQGRVQVLVLDKYDRTGRGNAQTILEYEASRAGLRIEYATAGPDTSTPAGAMMHAVQSVMSESERQNIAERMLKGKYERSRRGLMVLPSRIPFGYKAVRKFDDLGRRISSTLEADEATIAIYHRARRMLVEDGITLNQICKQFNREGIPSPAGAQWRAQTMRIVLSNRVYVGEYRFGLRIKKRVDTEAGVKSIQTGIRKEFISVPVPAVITEQQYADIVATIEDNKRRFERPRKHKYLLSGMIKCAMCGRSYNGNPSGQHVALRYRCRGNSSESRVCKARDVSATDLENTVWAIVERFMVEPDTVADSANEQKRRKADAVSIEAEIAAQQKAIDAARTEMQEAIALQARVGQAGEDVAESFVGVIAQIQQRINSARTIMADIERRREAIRAMRENEMEAERIRQELNARFDAEMTFDQKQQLLRRIRLSCIWDSEARLLSISSLIGSSTVHIAKKR